MAYRLFAATNNAFDSAFKKHQSKIPGITTIITCISTDTHPSPTAPTNYPKIAWISGIFLHAVPRGVSPSESHCD